eukprot:14416677-Alexandrium_andersonii.AAC.1
MAYDPVVEGLRSATLAPDPTFVDDLSAAVVGVPQSLTVQLFLLVASKAAGLHVEVHTCEPSVVPGDVRHAARCLRVFPVQVEVHQAFLVARGLPEALVRILVGATAA